MTNDVRCCFEILEIPTNSTEVVKEAYLDLVRVWHPDRFANDRMLERKANEKLKQINEAYEMILEFISATERERERTNSNFQESRPGGPARNTDNDCWHVYDLNGPTTITGSPKWRLSGHFSAEFRRLCQVRSVTLLESPRLIDPYGVEACGMVDIRKRIITLDANRATILTPAYLLARVFIRDLLAAPGLANARPRCLKALRQYGYEGSVTVSNPSYRKAEQRLAGEVAPVVVANLEKDDRFSGISGWWNDVKSFYRVKFSRRVPIDDFARHLGAMLLFTAPDWTMPQSQDRDQ